MGKKINTSPIRAERELESGASGQSTADYSSVVKIAHRAGERGVGGDEHQGVGRLMDATGSGGEGQGNHKEYRANHGG